MTSSINLGPAWLMDGPPNDGTTVRTNHVAASFLNTAGAQVYGGVMPSGNALDVTAPGGMAVGVSTGYALCPSSAGSTQGGYLVANMTFQTLTVTASDPTNPRIDLVVVYADDLGTSASAGYVAVITGTPAASPAAPSAPANSVILAQVAVAANATSIASGNITDTRTFTTAQGGITPVLAGGTPPVGYTGHYIHDRSTGRLMHNPASGAKQPVLLPFTWTRSSLASTLALPASGAETAVLSAVVTVGGSTDIDIYFKWAGIYVTNNSSIGMHVIFKLYIDSVYIDTWTVGSYNSSIATDSGSVCYRTGSDLGTTPAAGTHTIEVTGAAGSDGIHAVNLLGGAGTVTELRISAVPL